MKYRQAITKTNAAFSLALENHINALPPKEQNAFATANSINPDDLLAKVRELDEAHNRKSIPRKYEKVKGFLEVLNGYLGSLAIVAGCSPQISSIVVGAVKLVVDVCFHIRPRN